MENVTSVKKPSDWAEAVQALEAGAKLIARMIVKSSIAHHTNKLGYHR